MNAPQPMTALQLQQFFLNLGVPDQATAAVAAAFLRELQQGDCNIPVLLMDFARHVGAKNIQHLVAVYSDMIEVQTQVVMEASGSHLTIESIPCPELTTMRLPKTKALSGTWPQTKAQTKASNDTSKDPHVKRPANSWMHFRQFEVGRFPAHYDKMPVTQQSKEIAALWRAMGKEEKEYWTKVGKDEARRHKLAHPDYQFSPRKSSDIKKRLSPKKRQALAAAAAHDDQPSPDANNSPTPEPGPGNFVPHSEIPMTKSGNAVIDLGDPDLDDEELRRYLTSYNDFISNRPNHPINVDAINFTCLHSELTEASLSQKVFYETCAGLNVGETSWEEFLEEGAFA